MAHHGSLVPKSKFIGFIFLLFLNSRKLWKILCLKKGKKSLKTWYMAPITVVFTSFENNTRLDY